MTYSFKQSARNHHGRERAVRSKIKSLLKRFAGPGTRGNRSLSDKEVLVFRAVEHAVPLRVLQRVQSHELQRIESRRICIRDRRTLAHGRCDHSHIHYLSANSVWLEVNVVRRIA